MQMYKNFREEFPQLAECVKHIGSYCRETWDATLSEEEELYLMIHLNRIISKKGL
jgi:beta-glucoside operon transcriptional antiterminator